MRYSWNWSVVEWKVVEARQLDNVCPSHPRLLGMAPLERDMSKLHSYTEFNIWSTLCTRRTAQPYLMYRKISASSNSHASRRRLSLRSNS